MVKLSAPAPITNKHNFSGFNSGETSLDYWLKNRALKNQVSGASRCFVVCNSSRVIGYYCLSAGAISHERTPKKMRRNMPDPLPILLLGRLAVDRKYQNKGVGSALLRDALLRAVSVSADAGVFAILVHAISEDAKEYYTSRGFVQSPIQEMTLMMTLETVKAVLSE